MEKNNFERKQNFERIEYFPTHDYRFDMNGMLDRRFCLTESKTIFFIEFIAKSLMDLNGKKFNSFRVKNVKNNNKFFYKFKSSNAKWYFFPTLANNLLEINKCLI